MATDADPIVGTWYRHLDKGHRFEVVAIDENGGTVEIQHFDGDIEEIELSDWYDMDVETIEAPEDWSGPVDDFEEGDLDYTETDMKQNDWRDSLTEYSPGDSRSHNRSISEDFEEEDRVPDED